MLTLVGDRAGTGGDRPSTIELFISGRNNFGRAKRPSGALLTDHHNILGKNGDTVSRFHASVNCRQLPDGARCWLLKDHNSMDGLLLNLYQVTRNPNCGARLENGEHIAFGC